MIWKCGCQVAKWRGVSENRPPRRLPGRHRRLKNMFENGSKMVPKCFQNASKMAPWRPLGGMSGPSGIQKGIPELSGRLLRDSPGAPGGSWSRLEALLVAHGAVLGRSWRLWGPSWGVLGLHFRAIGAFLERALAKMRKPWFFFYDSTALFEVFSGSRGSKNRSRRLKIAPKRALEAPNSSRMSPGGSK